MQFIFIILQPFNLFTAPTGAPQNIIFTVSSTSTVFSWHQIKCIERNGVITNYTVVFQEQLGEAVNPVGTVNRNFTASGLTPHTNYTFSVAGVNSNGTGPYSNDITVLTDEDGKLDYTIHIIMHQS